MASSAWLHDLFRSIDRMDIQAFASFLAPDVVFRFGNQQAVAGRGAVTEAVRQFFASIEGLSHEIEQDWEQDDMLTCHGTVTYTRHDGSQLVTPFANVFALKGRQISRYLIFADISALYNPSQQ